MWTPPTFSCSSLGRRRALPRMVTLRPTTTRSSTRPRRNRIPIEADGSAQQRPLVHPDSASRCRSGMPATHQFLHTPRAPWWTLARSRASRHLNVYPASKAKPEPNDSPTSAATCPPPAKTTSPPSKPSPDYSPASHGCHQPPTPHDKVNGCTITLPSRRIRRYRSRRYHHQRRRSDSRDRWTSTTFLHTADLE